MTAVFTWVGGALCVAGGAALALGATCLAWWWATEVLVTTWRNTSEVIRFAWWRKRHGGKADGVFAKLDEARERCAKLEDQFDDLTRDPRTGGA